MSVERYDMEGVVISTFAGPYEAGGSRRHVQITVDGKFIQLDLERWRILRHACQILGPDCDQLEVIGHA